MSRPWRRETHWPGWLTPQSMMWVGELVISAPGTPDKKIPVAAGKSVNQLGLFGKAMLGLRGEDEEEEPEGKKE